MTTPDTQTPGPDKNTPAPPSESAPAGSFWSRHRNSLIGGAVAVVLLAGVIFWMAALSSTDSAPVADIETDLSATVDESSELYDQALEAEASGDTTEAVALLERVIELNPLNSAAREKLAELTNPTDTPSDTATPATDDGGGGGDDPPTGGVVDPGAVVEDLTVLLPTEVVGFQIGPPVAQGPDATVAGVPTVSGIVAAGLWAVHDREDAAGAQQFVDGVSKTAYPENSTEVEIDGANAYFGTNGQRYATIVYTNGRYVFEVILTAAGMPPGELLIEAEDAAKAFPELTE